MITPSNDARLYKTGEKKIIPAFGGEGQHRVKNITDHVKSTASKLNPFKLYADGKKFLDSKTTNEQVLYVVAALCCLIALAIFVGFTAGFGLAALPFAFSAALIPLGLGVLSYGLARAKTNMRKEWEMPIKNHPNPKELEGLWMKRNQERKQMLQKNEELKQAERMLARGKHRKMDVKTLQEKVILLKSGYQDAIHAFEQAELKFWEKGDPVEALWVKRNLGRKKTLELKEDLKVLKNQMNPNPKLIQDKEAELEIAMQALEDAEVTYWQHSNPQKAQQAWEKVQADRAKRGIN